MNVHPTSDWAEVVERLEAERRAPSEYAGLPKVWSRAVPDELTVHRLARLELRLGSPVLAMDLACWAMESFGDRPEARILAAEAAFQGGLSVTAVQLLRPLIVGLADRDQDQRRPMTGAWRDLALASGGAIELRQAVLIEPSDPEALTRTADDLWRERDHAAAMAIYRWAACSGTTVAKVYLRATSMLTGGVGLPTMVNMLESAYRRTGEARFKARLLVLLLKADRRLDAFALLDDSETFADGAETTAARNALIGYARAQLMAVDAETMDSTVAAAGDRWSAGQRRHQQAGRSLAAAGWHGPAVWVMRKATGGPKSR